MTEIRSGADLQEVRALCLESGLEDGPFGEIALSVGAYDEDHLVGCAVLESKGGKFAVEWLAVESGHRGRGLGSKLVARIEAEARSRGAVKIWALARAPEFFKAIGYRTAADSEALPSTGSCSRCPQYLRGCNPEVVYKDL